MLSHKVFIYLFFCAFLSRTTSSSVPREYGEFKLFQTTVTYGLNTSVSITDEYEGQRTFGYLIQAVVGVEPIWSDRQTDFLLKFHLESPKLFIAGKKGYVLASSTWDSLGVSSFYARLTHGAVQTVYLDERDPVDLKNYKKSIVSLIQFRAIDGETKETDISGSCDVVYESTSLTTIHKTKTRCSSDHRGRWSRRATYRFSQGLDEMQGVRVREQVTLDAGLAALVANTELTLEMKSADRSRTAPSAHDLEQALRSVPADFKPVDLTLQHEPQKWDWNEDLHSGLSELRSLSDASEEAEEGAGAGGDERNANAVLRALPAIAAADTAAVLRVLQDDQYYPVLPSLYRLVGQSGSGDALLAAIQELQLAESDAPRALSLQLLAGAARAARADRAARAALLKLARSARAPHVADAALLAASAQARRAGDDSRYTLRDLIMRDLARCKEDACRIVKLHALANLALPKSAEALLEHAERGTASVALAALDALDALPPTALHWQRLQALATRGGRALEVRAVALDMLLRRVTLAPAVLTALARELRRSPSELRRVFWQRVQMLAEMSDDVKRALNDLPVEDRSWLARSNQGTSHVLRRQTGWKLGDGAAQLHSTQFAAGGAVRRGIVALRQHAADRDDGRELLAVEVWTRGMESLAGSSEEALASLEEGKDAGAGVRGGLRLRIDGVHEPGVQLFDGQAELLGHIWSGAGSAATPVLRGSAGGVHIDSVALGGGVTLHCRSVAINTFAVDAQAQVSLWSRNAHALLELRAAAASEQRCGVSLGGARLQVTSRGNTAPKLELDAHADFYNDAALCVRAHISPHERSYSLTVDTERNARYRRTRTERRSGRTLALGRDNDRVCRDRAALDADSPHSEL